MKRPNLTTTSRSRKLFLLETLMSQTGCEKYMPSKTIYAKQAFCKTTMASAELKSYIYKVLKQAHPDKGMTSEAKQSINNLLNIVLSKLVWVASDRVQLRGKKTLQAEDIQFALTFVLPKELALPAWKEAELAVTKWIAAKYARGAANGTRRDARIMAGLTFPPARIENTVRSVSPIERVAKLTGLALAAVLEYLAAEILDFASAAAATEKKAHISANHVNTAVGDDQALAALYEGVLLPGGFVTYRAAEPADK